MHVYFECDDLDGEVATLKGTGIVFDNGPSDKAWLWREAWLRAPAGNNLCLYFAGDNRRHLPGVSTYSGGRKSLIRTGNEQSAWGRSDLHFGEAFVGVGISLRQA